jgi:gentisate 1,2-dioxygenase
MYSLLAGLRRVGALDLSHGYRVRYIDPGFGRDPLPTMSAFLGHLPAGFEGEWYRSSDSTVFVVSRGSGVTELEGQTIEWSENDIFMVPTWMRYRHIAAGDAVLFSFSDRNAQERLECWREQRNVV